MAPHQDPECKLGPRERNRPSGYRQADVLSLHQGTIGPRTDPKCKPRSGGVGGFSGLSAVPAEAGSSSSCAGARVDAIQIETTRDARNSGEDRARFARAMALALDRWFARHHGHRLRPWPQKR